MDPSNPVSTAPRQARAVGRDVVARLGSPTTGRVLAAVGALLVAVAAWAPWQELRVVYHLGPVQYYYFSPAQLSPTISLGPLSTPAAQLFWWSGLTVLGALLAPLLWQRTGALVTRVPLAALATWTVLASAAWVALVLTLARAPDVFATKCALVLGGVGSILPPCSAHLLSPPIYDGAWLALVGLLLTWAGVVLVVRAELRARGTAATPAARYATTQPYWRGSGMLLAGVLVWAAGFIALPWASVNCNGTPLFLGVCQGVSGSGALQAGIQAATTGYDPLAARYAGVLLLAGGGVLLLTGLWLRVAAVPFRVWGWLWALAALVVAVVAYNGVSAIIAAPNAFALPSGTWRGSPGLWVTFLAVLLAFAGLVRLELSARRTLISPAAPPSA